MRQRQRVPGLALDTWDRMMVSSAASAPVAHRRVSPGAAEALALIDAGWLAEGPAGRAAPSAGAIHPYECYVVSLEGSALAALHVDPVRRVCHRLPVGGSARELLAAAGVASPAAGDALIVIVTRPWLSMRKYGDRGYLYTQLDTGHFAASLLGLAADRDTVAGLRLRLRREPLADLLTIRDDCREIHSVLEVRSGGRAGDLSGWVVRDAGTAVAPHLAAGPERASWLERMCWQSLGPLVRDEALPHSPVARRPLLPAAAELPAAASLHAGADLPAGERIDLAGRWHTLSASRRSSKEFAEAAITAGALSRALSAARTPLAVDLPAETALQATLVVRSVAGRPNGARTGGAAAPSGDEVVQACMHQDHLRHAAAFVLFHVSRRDLIDHPPATMREMLFRAGALGQLLYLGATCAGVGVTGVGGFDARRWRLLADLPDDHELLYLVLFGRDGAASVKRDRLATAYAQIER